MNPAAAFPMGILEYHISSYSFYGNYSFLNLEIQRSQYIRPKVTVHICAETIQGRKLYEEVRYLEILQGSPIPFSLCKSCPFLQSCRNFQFRYHRGCLHHLCDLTRIIPRKLIFEIFIATVLPIAECKYLQILFYFAVLLVFSVQ